MAKLIITGGRALSGTVRVNAAKNACLPLMAASILTDGPTVLTGVPHLTDVGTLCAILHQLGVKTERTGHQRLMLQVTDEHLCRAPQELTGRMRGSICVLGPLLARRGYAEVPLPGGCVLGPRPIDLHIKGLRALGADIRARRGCLYASAGRLKGTRVFLNGPNGSTVLGTANVMMAATLAEGTTIIEYAACEPEVQDLAGYLNACGARISGVGTSRIIIEGVRELTGTFHAVIPDRIEAGTLAVAAAITGGDVLLENVCADHLTAVIDVMRRMDVHFEAADTSMRVRRGGALRGVDFTAQPYPGVPTDMQPQLLALLCVAEGRSQVSDAVFPDRFTQARDLRKLGARMRRRGEKMIVRGPATLRGAPMTVRDLRGGASLILAALAAEGVSAVDEVHHVDRGYEQLEQKLSALGAEVVREGAESAETGPVQGPRLRAAS